MKAKLKSTSPRLTRELRDQDCANKLLSAALEKAKLRIAELESQSERLRKYCGNFERGIAERDSENKRIWGMKCELETRISDLSIRCEMLDAEGRKLRRELDGAQLNLTAQMAMNADAKNNIAQANEQIGQLLAQKHALTEAFKKVRPWSWRRSS